MVETSVLPILRVGVVMVVADDRTECGGLDVWVIYIWYRRPDDIVPCVKFDQQRVLIRPRGTLYL